METKEILNFINKSPSAFHCVCNMVKALEKEGFEEICMGDCKNLKKGNKYYILKNNSAIIAFTLGDWEKGFKIITAHNDSPCPYLKPNPIISDKMGYSFFDTEIYGGALLPSWTDRPLCLCGRVVKKTNDVFKPKEELINIEKPVAIIPNLAIHLNRELNNGFKYGKQKELLPMICVGKSESIYSIIEEYANIAKEDILDFELFLYPAEKACVVGTKDDFISSARLDNLLMSFAALNAISNAEAKDGINMIYCADNEEIGSLTAQGALSGFLKSVINRIAGSGCEAALSKSFVISADAAHGMHPCYADKYDIQNTPVVGEGICLKYSAAKKYSTDSVSGGVFKSLCSKAEIKMQKFANHSDIGGGSTIGAMIAADLGIPVADMGVPLIGMHSARELAGVRDVHDCIKLFNTFFDNN